MLCAVELDEAVQIFVEGFIANVRVDGVAELLPFFDGGIAAEVLCDEDGAIEGDPRHHFGVGELPASTAGFPDAFVGPLPDGFEVIEQEHERAKVVGGVATHAAEGVIEGVEQLAVNVELHLTGGGVADAHGARFFVAWKPVDFPLDELAFALEAVHDLDLVGAAGDGAQEPILPCDRFVEVSCGGHGEEGEGGVTEPAVAVVPVARATDGFGQRRGDGGDLAAGGAEGHRLEGDEGALDSGSILALVFEA